LWPNNIVLTKMSTYGYNKSLYKWMNEWMD
jgi:hypothetical protein